MGGEGFGCVRCCPARAKGLPALSVNWGAWADVGMVRNLGTAGERRIERYGVGDLSPALAVQILEALIVQDCVQMGVMPIQWDKSLSSFRDDQQTRLFTELGKELGVRERKAKKGTRDDDLLEALGKATKTERHSILLDFVRKEVVKVLGLEPSEPLSAEQSLSQMGLDSLMAIELRNQIQTRLSLDVSMAQLLEGPSTVEVSEHLTDLLEQRSVGAVQSKLEGGNSPPASGGRSAQIGLEREEGEI